MAPISSIRDTACPVWWIDALSSTTTLLGFEPSKGNNWGSRDSSMNLQNSSSSMVSVVMRTSSTPSMQIAAMAECLLPLTSTLSAMAGVPLGEKPYLRSEDRLSDPVLSTKTNIWGSYTEASAINCCRSSSLRCWALNVSFFPRKALFENCANC